MERGLGRRQQRKRPKDEELQTLKPSFLRRGWGRRQPLKNFKPNQGFPPLSSPARWLRPAKVQASQVSSQLTSLSGERRGKCLTFLLLLSPSNGYKKLYALLSILPSSP
ncbi:hypothetical protein Rs2_26185 [Raphanus sativus]|nr:hypothetical protein Rs2_26185 [Raphanus sativus]